METKKTVDNLMIYDPQFEFDAGRFADEMGGSTATHPVKNMEDLKAALNGYNAVKFLEIDLHGSPGMIWLADKTVVVGSYLNQLCQNPAFLQKDARILFDNCEIGLGEIGDTFMASFGTGLLKGKGGTVGAATVKTLSHPLIPFSGVFMLPVSAARLKVKRYDESGKEVGSRTVDRYGTPR